MLNFYDKEILRLIQRSPDVGDGWRSVSKVCWKLIEKFTATELVEIDALNRKVRLTDSGKIVVDFAL